MALIDYQTLVPKVDPGRSLEVLVEEYAHRVPATEETMSQLDKGSRRFYLRRLRAHTCPPLSELAARCVRNEGLRQVANAVEVPKAEPRYQTRAQEAPVGRVYAGVGRRTLRYQRHADLVCGDLRVYVEMSSAGVQTSAAGVL